MKKLCGDCTGLIKRTLPGEGTFFECCYLPVNLYIYTAGGKEIPNRVGYEKLKTDKKGRPLVSPVCKFEQPKTKKRRIK